ncbi:MAG: HAMP domain-containing protein [Nannocystaceae bacterium]
MLSSLRRAFALVSASLGVTAVGVTGALAYSQAEGSLEAISFRALTFGRNEKRERVLDYLETQRQAVAAAAQSGLGELVPLVDRPAEAPPGVEVDFGRLASIRGYTDVVVIGCGDGEPRSLLHPGERRFGATLSGEVAAACRGEASPRIADFSRVPRGGAEAVVAYAIAPIRETGASAGEGPGESPRAGGERPRAVIAFELPIAPINAIMTSALQWSQGGLGASGETYVVGDDGLMRSESRFLVEEPERLLERLRAAGIAESTLAAIAGDRSTILRMPVDTAAGRAASTGASGTEVLVDYRGVDVLSSYAPLTLPGIRWAIVSEIDVAEAFAAAAALRRQVVILATVLALFLGLVGVVLAARVARPLGKLARLAERMGEGELFHRMNIEGRGEIATLARAFDAMAERLAAKQRALEEEVARRRELEREIVNVTEREKQRLGHDLHDGLAQQLAGIAYLLQALGRRSTDAEQWSTVHGHVTDAIRTCRLLARGLYPVDMVIGDIHRTLEVLCDSLASLYRCTCTYEGDESIEIDDPEVSLHLYRIVQEATANAVRHGAARHVRVRLGVEGEDDLALTIENDGEPFAGAAADGAVAPDQGKGMGLRTMEIRASVLGGRLEVTSRAAEGTRVVCVFPRLSRSRGATLDTHG